MTRQMKNTRFHWMGEIPSHWKLIKLGYLCSLKGRIGWKGLRSDEFLEDSYAYLVTGQDFVGDTVNWAACYQIEKGRYDEDPYIQLKKGDLLVTKDGTIGKVAKVHILDKPACLNSGIFVLRQTANKFDQSYLYWQLNSSLLTDYNSFVNSGASTIQHLYQNVFERMPLIVPPLSEQKAIADFLDTKCAEIDGLLADLDAEVKTLTEYKKSIIAEIVTHGLNPNAPMKQLGLGWIDEVPAHWAISRIASLYTVRNEKVSDKDYMPLSVTMKGIVPQLDNAAKTKHGDDRKLIRKGDFVINSRSDRRGSCGISPYEGSCSLINTVLAPREKMNPLYYDWLFHTSIFADEFYKWGYGIVDDLWTTNWGAMRRIQIPVPPIEEQEGIAHFLNSKVPQVESTIADKLQQIETLKAYKSSLIYEYVTGKKQVI